MPLAPGSGVTERLELHMNSLETHADLRVGEMTHGYETVLLSKKLVLWCCRDDNKLEIVYCSQSIRHQVSIVTRTGRNLD